MKEGAPAAQPAGTTTTNRRNFLGLTAGVAAIGLGETLTSRFSPAQAATLLAAPGSSTTTVANLEGIRFADQFPGSTPALQIQAANDDLAGATGVVVIPSTMGVGSAPTPSATTTFMDLRSKTYLTNPVMSGISITTGSADTDWAKFNTGGLARSKWYVFNKETALSVGGAGIIAVCETPTGTPTNISSGTVYDGALSIVLTQAGTNTNTNGVFIAGHEVNTVLYGGSLSLYDLRGLTASVFTGIAPAGMVGSVRVLTGQQGTGPFPAALHFGRWTSLHAQSPLIPSVNMQCTGTLSTSGTSATWVSGDKFSTQSYPGMPIVINGVTYVVAAIAGETSLTLSASAGSQTAVPFTFTGGQYGAIVESNVWIRADHTAVADPLGGGGLLIDTQSGSTDPTKAVWIRDASYRNADQTLKRIPLLCRNGDLVIRNQAFTTDLLIVSGGGGVASGAFVLAGYAAANQISINGAAAGSPVVISATGADAGIDIQLSPKGSGLLNIQPATTTASAPPAGGAGALPATPAGYVSVKIAGLPRLLAFY